jgi:hypothetical protein
MILTQKLDFGTWPRFLTRRKFGEPLGPSCHRQNSFWREVRALLLISLATPAGLEPATCRLEGGCSFQLSYGAITANRLPKYPQGINASTGQAESI